MPEKFISKNLPGTVNQVRSKFYYEKKKLTPSVVARQILPKAIFTSLVRFGLSYTVIPPEQKNFKLRRHQKSLMGLPLK